MDGQLSFFASRPFLRTWRRNGRQERHGLVSAVAPEIGPGSSLSIVSARYAKEYTTSVWWFPERF